METTAVGPIDKTAQSGLAILVLLVFTISLAVVPFSTSRQDIGLLNHFDFMYPMRYLEPSMFQIFFNGLSATVLASLILSIPVIVGLWIFIKKGLGYKLLGIIVIPLLLMVMFILSFLNPGGVFTDQIINRFQGGIGGIDLFYGDMIPYTFMAFPVLTILIFFVAFMALRIKFKYLNISLIILLLLVFVSKVYFDSVTLKTENRQQWTEDRDMHFENIANFDLHNRLGFDRMSIKKISMEFKNWPNNCLGFPVLGEICKEVDTPGVEVKLSADGKIYNYHIDQNATGLDALLVRSASE